MWYIVTWEDRQRIEHDLSSGLVLGVVDSMNPEEAMVEISNRVLDDEMEEEMSAASKVGLAQWILETTDKRDEDHAVRVYQLSVDEVGNPIVYSMEDLEFEGEEPRVKPPEHLME